MMNSTQINSDERVGWEQIWRSDDIPPRYRSLAAPNDTFGASSNQVDYSW